jgi:hypothetical protein
MRYIRWGGNRLSGLAAGFVLLGVAALPMAGCSQSVTPPPSDEATASPLTGSSMSVQGAVPTEHSTSDAAAASNPVAPDAQTAAPGAASAAAVPAPIVPPVTSPTTAALAVAAPINPSPVAPPNLGQTGPAAAVVASTGNPALNVASTGNPVLKGLNGNGMQGSAQTLNPAMMHALKEFQVASASFPDFCRDWAHKLSVREHDNLGNIQWVMRDGVETGSYVGYSSIDSCTCKQASNGVSVGVLTYKEFDYTLSGKSVEEAEHSTPHAATVVPTREIFAYDKGKWFW